MNTGSYDSLITPFFDSYHLQRVGVSLNDKGRFEEALKILRESVSLDSNRAGTWWALSHSYRRTGELENAHIAVNKALEINPKEMVFRYELLDLGREYNKLEHHGEAVSIFKEVLRLDPQLLEVRLRLAVTYEKLGAVEHAIEEYRSYLSLEPENSTVKDHLQRLEDLHRH